MLAMPTKNAQLTQVRISKKVYHDYMKHCHPGKEEKHYQKMTENKAKSSKEMWGATRGIIFVDNIDGSIQKFFTWADKNGVKYTVLKEKVDAII